MAKTIQQSITFNAKAAKLYALYADSKMHSAVTGFKATVGPAGKKMSAFGGEITGKVLHTVKNKQLVQTWRSKGWGKTIPDSVLVLNFEDTKKGGTVNLVHSNLADKSAKGVTDGWKQYYWNSWKKFLDPPKPVKKAAAKKSAAKKVVKKAAKKPAARKKAAPRRKAS